MLFRSLRNTGKILFGKMNRMGRPLSWHLVRRRWKRGRVGLGSLTLRSKFFLCSNITPSEWQPGTHLDQTGKLIKYSDFVNKELILFSMADLQRSIPSMVDGLKPGQRKILFYSFKRNFVKEAKVAQFSGCV